MKNTNNIGLRFDNSYTRLPKNMMCKINPIPVKKPKLIIFNHTLSKELNLDLTKLDETQLALIFSGNYLPSGSEPIAQAYAGHQFGYFSMLGDGRAVLIGEHITKNNKRVDIQFKGSGKTPFSRGGDGRAVLGPMLREYIISEAMHALKIPTTRSLAVVETGENIEREISLPGSILTRIADSHIRVGTFEYLSMKGDIKSLKILVNYTINRHFPYLKNNENLALSLLKEVIERQIKLIINWMRVGFIHGVMNTDNMAISGETIDYGPCAFMDFYNPETVFSSIDHQGRYSYINQPVIAHWNLSRFAETLLPLIDIEKDKAIEIAKEVINDFSEKYKKSWFNMLRKKLGLFGNIKEDEILIQNLLLIMKEKKLDYTNTFCTLMNNDFFDNSLLSEDLFNDWFNHWKKRLKQNNKPSNLSIELMKSVNPLVIPRNHKVEEALEAAYNNDLVPFNKLLKILKKPYDISSNITSYQMANKDNLKTYKTFCGT